MSVAVFDAGGKSRRRGMAAPLWLSPTAFADNPRSPAELAVAGGHDQDLRDMADDSPAAAVAETLCRTLPVDQSPDSSPEPRSPAVS